MTHSLSQPQKPFLSQYSAGQGVAVFGNAVPGPGYNAGKLYYGGQALNRAGYNGLIRGAGTMGLIYWLARGLDKTVGQKESVMGQSHTRFAQDTATVLGGKLTAVRSAAEALEAFFLEFVESALFYYSVPFIGKIIRHGWLKLMPDDAKQQIRKTWLEAVEARELDKRIAEAGGHVSGQALTTLKSEVKQYIAEVTPKHYQQTADAVKTSAKHLGLKAKDAFETASKGKKALVALKGATIFSVLSVVVLEYGLNFVKNLMTLEVFNQGDFTDVVNLTDNVHKKQHVGEHPTETKAKRWIKNCALIAGGILAASYGLVAGRNKKWVFNINKALINKLDFSYARKLFRKKGDKEWSSKMTMGLGDWQMRLIIILGGLGYLHAARDDLELKETFFRVQCVVVPYLAFGQQMLENLYAKTARAGLLGPKLKASFDRISVDNPDVRFSDNKLVRWFERLLVDDKKLKDHKDIVHDVLSNTTDATGTRLIDKYTLNEFQDFALKRLPEDTAKSMKEDLSKAFKEYKPQSISKINAFLAPFLTGVLVVGSGVAWMNRFWTAARFNKIQQDKATALFRHVHIDRRGVDHNKQIKKAQANQQVQQAKRVALNPNTATVPSLQAAAFA